MIVSRSRDNLKFVVGVHREQIRFINRQQFKQEIDRFSVEFETRLCYIKPSGVDRNYVAFSNEDGVSFGDAIVEHYKAENLVWCGSIDGGRNFALVIIQSGNVVSEDIFSATQEDGLASLATLALEEAEFDVYYESETPLPFLQYMEAATNIKTQIELSQSIIEELSPREELHFSPKNQASAELRNNKAFGLPGLCICVGIVIAGYLIWPEEKKIYPTIVLDEFKEYRVKLDTPAPVDVLRTLYDKSRALTLAKNWELNSCIYNAIDRAAQCVLDPTIMATVAELYDSSEKLNGTVQFKDSQAIIHFDMKLNARSKIDTISPLDDVSGFVRDNIVNELIPNTLTFKERVMTGEWMSQQLSFSKAATGLSSLMVSAMALQGIPGSIKTVRLTKSTSLYQLEITLSLFGAK